MYNSYKKEIEKYTDKKPESLRDFIWGFRLGEDKILRQFYLERKEE